MRRLSLVLVLTLPFAGANAAEKKPAVISEKAVVSEKASANSTAPWVTRGGWDHAAFNRSVQVDEIGRSAFRSKGRFSLEVVGSGEKGDVLLRFFDAAGAPLTQVQGRVHGVDTYDAGQAKAGQAMAHGGVKTHNWSDAGFDGASPFTSKALADGSVRVEIRSSKYQGLYIEGTLPVVQSHVQSRVR